MQIHKITKKDFTEWMAMGLEFWPKHTEKEIRNEFNRIVNSKQEESFICKDGDRSLGFIAVAIRTDYVEGSIFSPKKKPVGYLEAIYVKKAFRKRGVAKLLMKEGLTWLKKNGCKEVGSDVRMDNSISQTFHKKIGFKKGEILVHYIRQI